MKKTSYTTQLLTKRDSLEEWDAFVDESPQGSLFCKSWWLGAVSPDRFRILILSNKGNIVAGMPLPEDDSFGKHIGMPKLTQTLGVLFRPSDKKTYEERLTEEMERTKALLEAVPSFQTFSMNFHYDFTNWLPFYWKGYRQTTYYTYVFEDLRDLEHVFLQFVLSKRGQIEKASSALRVSSDIAAKDFYEWRAAILRKRGKRIDYSFHLFERIHKAALEQSSGILLGAFDEKNNMCAALFVVYDTHSAYYLLGANNPDSRYGGALAFLQKEAIAYVSQYTNRFDFEGSTIQGVEHSFRKFGAVQKPYFSISKDNRSFATKITTKALGAMKKLWRVQA